MLGLESFSHWDYFLVESEVLFELIRLRVSQLRGEFLGFKLRQLVCNRLHMFDIREEIHIWLEYFGIGLFERKELLFWVALKALSSQRRLKRSLFLFKN